MAFKLSTRLMKIEFFFSFFAEYEFFMRAKAITWNIVLSKERTRKLKWWERKETLGALQGHKIYILNEYFLVF